MGATRAMQKAGLKRVVSPCYVVLLTVYGTCSCFGILICLIWYQGTGGAFYLATLNNLFITTSTFVANRRLKGMGMETVQYILTRVLIIKLLLIADTVVIGMCALHGGLLDNISYDLSWHFAWLLEAYWYYICIRWLGDVYLKK